MNERELLGVVGDVLAGSGFRRRGTVLRRVGTEVAGLVGVRKDRWSELRYLELGLNFTSPQRLSSVAPLRESDITVELDSLVSPAVRVEVLDVFDLGKELNDEARRARLTSLTETVVRPWLDKASTITGVGQMVREGLLPESFLPLVARRCLAKHCGTAAERRPLEDAARPTTTPRALRGRSRRCATPPPRDRARPPVRRTERPRSR